MPARAIVVSVLLGVLRAETLELDERGYVAYCPCMGRFGNQADHFLGALAFAKGLDRTLILPPWVEYRTGEARSIQVPFDEYFDAQPLRRHHRVVPMAEFMERLAARAWPPENRTSFCYATRGSDGGAPTCDAKHGNPFGPFWDTFGVDFVRSEFYGPLLYDVHRGTTVEDWNERYPAAEWPVLAFTGAPASFPVQRDNVGLQRHLKWNAKMTQRADAYVRANLRGGFIGIHLRNGADWVRTCEHVAQSQNLFSSPQCLGYRNEYGKLTQAMCLPSKHDIIRQLKRQLKITKDVKHIFVASDSDHMVSVLEEGLKRHNLNISYIQPSDPHLDLVILGLSNHFIGNCVSSYTAFVKRARDVEGYPSSFWAFPTEKSRLSHEEL